MRGDKLLFLAVFLTVPLLFWSTLLAVFVACMAGLYFLYQRGIFRLLRKFRFSKNAKQKQDSSSSATPEKEGENTLITMVIEAPYRLLGIAPDAGTGTILSAFRSHAKEEQNSNLRLSKNGRRMMAAKNEMLSRRRRKGTERSSVSQAKSELKESLRALLEVQPIYKGKVIHLKSISPDAINDLQVGVEVSDISRGTALGNEPARGKGNCCFVIYSETGRLVMGSNDGHVAFLPGTRFVILKREAWKNPDGPIDSTGYLFELAEVM